MLGFDALGRLALGEAPTATATAYAVSVEPASFAVVGQEVATAISVPVDPASFVVSGQVGIALTLPVEAASFTVTGQTVEARANIRLRCDPFVATTATHFGAAPLGVLALGQGFLATETSVTYALSGSDVVFRHTLPVESASFVFTGQNVAPFLGNITSTTPAAIVLTFQPVGFHIRLPVQPASFVFTGQAQLYRRSPKLRRFPRVGSTTATARTRGAGVKVRAYGG